MYVRGIELVVNTKTEDELYNMFKEELRKSINVDGDRHKLLVEFTDQARLDVSR
jgi:hypothetical protein